MEYSVAEVWFGRRNEGEIVESIVFSTDIAVLLLAFSIDDKEGHFAANDGLEHFKLVAISGDEERLYVFADWFEGKALDIFM